MKRSVAYPPVGGERKKAGQRKKAGEPRPKSKGQDPKVRAGDCSAPFGGKMREIACGAAEREPTKWRTKEWAFREGGNLPAPTRTYQELPPPTLRLPYGVGHLPQGYQRRWYGYRRDNEWSKGQGPRSKGTGGFPSENRSRGDAGCGSEEIGADGSGFGFDLAPLRNVSRC